VIATVSPRYLISVFLEGVECQLDDGWNVFGLRNKAENSRVGRRRPKVTAVVGVEIRLSAYGRALLPRHCNVPHCAERRRDSDPDS
jgi:hypothetical protein